MRLLVWKQTKRLTASLRSVSLLSVDDGRMTDECPQPKFQVLSRDFFFFMIKPFLRIKGLFLWYIVKETASRPFIRSVIQKQVQSVDPGLVQKPISLVSPGSAGTTGDLEMYACHRSGWTKTHEDISGLSPSRCDCSCCFLLCLPPSQSRLPEASSASGSGSTGGQRTPSGPALEFPPADPSQTQSVSPVGSIRQLTPANVS